LVKEAAIPSTVQASSTNEGKPRLPTTGNLAVKCPKCKEILYSRDWQKNLKICSRCGYHFKLTAYERIDLLADPDSFVELDTTMLPEDPLHFVVNPPNTPKTVDYADKLITERQKAAQNEAIISGHATIEGNHGFSFYGRQHGLRGRRAHHTCRRKRHRTPHPCAHRLRIRGRTHARRYLLFNANGKDIRRSLQIR
jgi:DNA-directed RNA polymerase subunit M/transcription elongation factor TFIIS